MKTLKILIPLILLFVFCASAVGQKGKRSSPNHAQIVEEDSFQCKDKPLPFGYEVVRDTGDVDCPGGRAVVIRRKGAHPPPPATASPNRPTTIDWKAKWDEVYAQAQPVKIVAVSTDQRSYLDKYLKITGYLTLSSYYNYGYNYAESTHLAFRLEDGSSGWATVYIKRSSFADQIRNDILHTRNNRILSTCVIRLRSDRYEEGSDLLADLILVYPPEQKQ